MAPYKTYAKIEIDPGSDPKYLPGVTACLDVIEGLPDGKKLLTDLCALSHAVTITDTNEGNSCSTVNDSLPLLTRAIATKNQTQFQQELTAVFGNAKRKGMPLEHFARQLSMGLSPVTYEAKANVVRPGATAGAGPVGTVTQTLNDLMSGVCPLAKLPGDWRFQLPRLLRAFLTPGRGADSTVNFNYEKTFSCKDDPAMHKRPPAVGLAHELIHALHNGQGMNMVLVANNGQNLEELITTGLPPYNFEALSDNKMRTQWPSNLALRLHY